MKVLTFIPLEKINEIAAWDDQRINEAKEILAFEITKMVHGEEEAQKAQDAARAIFSTGSAENMPIVNISSDDFTDGEIDIRKLLVCAGFASSMTEGKRAVEQGGVSVNGDKISDPFYKFKNEDFNEEFVLKKGKKKFCRIELKK